MKTLLFITLWLASGAGSFIYWWTKDFPFRAEDIPTAAIVSAMGPVAFFGGWVIHGEPIFTCDTILIRRRGK